MRNLKSIIDSKKLVRLLESHNPLSASIVELTDFDGMWSSSLTDSASMALPDCELHSIQKRLDNIQYIFNVTSKPMIMDVDSGGRMEHLAMNLNAIQRMGISGVIIEDKIGLKQNSLYGKDCQQQQDSIENFSKKLTYAHDVIHNHDFLLICRIESLILGETVQQALYRANAYINSGANGVMIHSVEKDPVMLMEFVDEFRKQHDVPLVVVPTTFNGVHASTFHNAGVNVIIYANHLLRASFNAMTTVANQILKDGMTANIESEVAPVKELLSFIPGNDPK